MTRKKTEGCRLWAVGVLLCVLCVLCGGLAGGCATATQMAVDDHRAAFSRAAADKINAGTVQDVADNALYIAWIMENIARGDANRAARNRWEKPPFPHPAKMPTSLPYTPEDNIPQGGSTDLCK